VDVIVLAIPDCPGATLLEERLATVASGLPGVRVTRRVITGEAEAVEAGMRGSPTLLVDGADPFARPGRQPATGVGSEGLFSLISRAGQGGRGYAARSCPACRAAGLLVVIACHRCQIVPPMARDNELRPECLNGRFRHSGQKPQAGAAVPARAGPDPPPVSAAPQTAIKSGHGVAGQRGSGPRRRSSAGIGESAVIGEDDQLSPVASTDLDHGAVDVRLDGGRAEHEPRGDLVVGQASRHQRGDLAFAFG
jgi:hypothetical protein